jgi:hypothetical protein
MDWRVSKRTDDQLAQLRADATRDWDIDLFTCDKCDGRHVCKFAFDPYNVDGDCLAEK